MVPEVNFGKTLLQTDVLSKYRIHKSFEKMPRFSIHMKKQNANCRVIVPNKDTDCFLVSNGIFYWSFLISARNYG